MNNINLEIFCESFINLKEEQSTLKRHAKSRKKIYSLGRDGVTISIFGYHQLVPESQLPKVRDHIINKEGESRLLLDMTPEELDALAKRIIMNFTLGDL